MIYVDPVWGLSPLPVSVEPEPVPPPAPPVDPDLARFDLGEYRAGHRLVTQRSTGDRRWVSMRAIAADGIATAYYDADPVWAP